MVEPVDNHSLASVAEVVFANSAGYYVELPMVGREAETATLLGVLADNGVRHTVTVTAPLGAGKTFFLNTVLGRHHRSHPEFDDRRNCQFVLATDLTPPKINGERDELGVEAASDDDRVFDFEPLFAGVQGRQVLVVEELDRKASLGQIRWTVASAIAWLSRGEDRALVLTGDMTLSGRHLKEFLVETPSLHRLELAPLDLELLQLALQARIRDKLLVPANPKASTDQLGPVADVAVEQILADPFIRWSVAPQTDPALLATFRDALGILRTYAQNARSHSGAVEFSRGLIELLPHDDSALAGLAAELAAAVNADVAVSIAEGRPLVARSVEELADLAGHPVTPRYRTRVVQSMVRRSLLVPLGVPYDETYDEGDGEVPVALTGPFMPSYLTVHTALVELARRAG